MARTESDNSNYLRTWTDHAVWSAWEPIELDLTVDHLIPVVFDGRLMLFWPVFTEKTIMVSDEQSQSYWEIQLAWSEYRHGRWTPKRMSLATAIPQVYIYSDESQEALATEIPQEDFVLRTTQESDGSLTIGVWIHAAHVPGASLDLERFHTQQVCQFSMANAGSQPEVMSSLSEEELIGIPSYTVPRAGGFTSFGYSASVRDEFLCVPVTGAEDPDEQLQVLDGGRYFWLIPPHDSLSFRADETLWFYWDNDRSFLVEPRAVTTAEEQETSASTFGPGNLYGQVVSALFSPPSTLPSVNVPNEDIAWFPTPTQMSVAPMVQPGGTLSRQLKTSEAPQNSKSLSIVPATSRRTASLPGGGNAGKSMVALAATVPLMGGAAGLSPSIAKMFTYASGDAGDFDRDFAFGTQYRFHRFYHPYIRTFISQLWRFGVDGLYSPDPDGAQGDLYRQAVENSSVFDDSYSPTDLVLSPYPSDCVDFDYGGPYAEYNWEIFFHAPMLVSAWLSRNYRFEEAQRWLHFIFDPTTPAVTGDEDAQRFWKLKPFYRKAEAPIADLLALLASAEHTDETAALRDRLERQVAAWRASPFDPHALAALRTTAYQKAVVKAYLDNLIAWGDHLFQQDTIETINEATQLYVLAQEILGEKPVFLEPTDTTPSGDTLETIVDDGVTSSVAPLEELLARVSTDELAYASTGEPLDQASLLYFQVPSNPWLLEYWDVVEDRLYKIRNCMNIEGVVRQLALFEPPIDPGMLISALSRGGSLSDVLSSLSQPRPYYRFSVMVQRAMSLNATVRALGGALLSALEKKDAEALAAMRASHEVALLDIVRSVKEQHLEEAKHSLEGLRRTQRVTRARHKHFTKLVDDGLNNWEVAQRDSLLLAGTLGSAVPIARALAIPSLGFPQVYVGAVGPMPKGETETGGQTFATGAIYAAHLLGDLATIASNVANISGHYAANKRRQEEWEFQRDQADKELKSLDKQLAAAEARVEAASRDLQAHDRHVAHAKEAASFLTAKFTNQQLYDWMAGQLSTVYSQSYQLAYQLARKAEKAWQAEIGESHAFVQYGHWDSLRRGLLAGERLQLDLERMDVAYLDANQRELELTKVVSLKRLDALALIRLRETGECYFDVPEALFDLDCPGHYFRRLSSVSVTVAASGAKGLVHAELTQQASKLRRLPSTTATLEEEACACASIVTSSAVEDPGVFSADPSSPRYLPFERTGAVSSWHLRFMNQAYPQFDWSTVGDVVLHLRYTARDGGTSLDGSGGGKTFREKVLEDLPGELDALAGGQATSGGTGVSTGAVMAISARRDCPSTWKQAQNAETPNTITLTLGAQSLPYFAQGRVDDVGTVHVLLVGGATSTSSGGTVDSDNLSTFDQWPSAESNAVRATASSSASSWPEEIVITLASPNDDLSDLDDLVVVIEYSVSVPS